MPQNMALLGQNVLPFLLVRRTRPPRTAHGRPNIQVQQRHGERKTLRDVVPVNVFVKLQLYAQAGLGKDRVYRLEENMKINKWDL